MKDARAQQYIESYKLPEDIFDPKKELYKDNFGSLKYISLKNMVDYVICWERGNCMIKDDIHVICLKNMKMQTKFR